MIKEEERNKDGGRVGFGTEVWDIWVYWLMRDCLLRIGVMIYIIEDQILGALIYSHLLALLEDIMFQRNAADTLSSLACKTEASRNTLSEVARYMIACSLA